MEQGLEMLVKSFWGRKKDLKIELDGISAFRKRSPTIGMTFTHWVRDVEWHQLQIGDGWEVDKVCTLRGQGLQDCISMNVLINQYENCNRRKNGRNVELKFRLFSQQREERHVIDESYKFLTDDEAPYGFHQTTR
jgi:hypothetical protein